MDQLHQEACAARENAHAPYSAFRVGAALETTEGRRYAGCNVENASYGLTICAERSAVFAAITAGDRSFRRIVVITEEGSPPCGACLQVLREFGPELMIELGTPQEIRLRTTLAELLPRAYAPGD